MLKDGLLSILDLDINLDIALLPKDPLKIILAQGNCNALQKANLFPCLRT